MANKVVQQEGRNIEGKARRMTLSSFPYTKQIEKKKGIKKLKKKRPEVKSKYIIKVSTKIAQHGRINKV